MESVSEILPFRLDYVKRTGASLSSKLCKSKFISTGPKYGISTNCHRNRCKTCNYMSNKNKVRSKSNKFYKSGSGTCCTKNVV